MPEEHVGDNNTNSSWCTWNSLQRMGKQIGTVGKQMKNKDYTDYSIDEINKNTEKSPGGLKRLAVTQTRVKAH